MKFSPFRNILHSLHRPKSHLFAFALGSSLIASCASSSVEGVAGLEAHKPTEIVYSNYLMGYFAEETWRFGKAAAMLDAVLKTDADNVELLQRAMRSHLAIGQTDQAVERAKAFLDQAPPRVKRRIEGQMAHLLVALDDLKAGEFEAVLAAHQNIRDQAAYRLIRPFLKAWAHAGLKQWDSALASISAVKEQNGLAQIALNHSVMIQIMAGKEADAIAQLRTLSPDGMELPIENFRLYARLLLNEEGDQAAEALMKQYVGRLPGQPDLSYDLTYLQNNGAFPPMWETEANGLAGIFYSLGQSYSRQEPYFSLLMGQLSLMLDPAQDRSRLLVADLLGDHENWDAALAAYEAVEDGSAYGWEARLDRADLLAASGRDDDAIDVLESMADERETDPDPMISIGLIHSGNEAFVDAIPYFDEAEDRMGETLPSSAWFFYYRRGIAFERAQRWDDAEADFRKSLSLRPETPQVLNYLGYSLLDRGEKLDEAIDMVRRAVDQSKSDGYIVDSYGWGYYLLGDYQAAVEQLERAVSLVPYDPVINDHLGDAYWKTGREREARFQWRRALSLEPEEKFIPVIEDKIENGM